jgi:glucose-6-phosphate isomerase
MTNADWKRFQQYFLDVPELGFSIDASALAFPERTFSEMEPRLAKAYAAMSQLEAGAIANPDEGRQVGHYWLRDPERAPDPRVRDEIEKTNARIAQFAAAVHNATIKPPKAARFENVLIVGIGGSALGPQLVSAALGNPNDRMRLFFVDNTDPDGIDLAVAKLAATKGGLAATLTVVISKSGGTKETRNGMLETANAYKRAGLDPAPHFVAITGEGSELDAHAKTQHWLERFPMWDWVGGRTSVMSAVGLLGMALQGLDTKEFLAGARAMDARTREANTKKNPAAWLALCWHHATGGAGKKDMVVLPYKDRLELFSRYLQQLVMESLGKEKDLSGKTVEQGIAVYGNKGSTDQHAYVQQLRDGVANFFVTFVEVLRDRAGASMEVDPGAVSGDYLSAFLLGTRRALREKGRESITLTIPDVSARSLGALIALYERTVGLYASLVNINAYHQPGVEAGKKAAASVLALQATILAALRGAKGNKMTTDEIAAAAKTDDTETVFKILRHVAANPDHGVAAEPAASPFETKYFSKRG